MSRGRFEVSGEENGLPVYALRWENEPERGLSEREQRYARFIRYLMQQGRLGEGLLSQTEDGPRFPED